MFKNVNSQLFVYKIEEINLLRLLTLSQYLESNYLAYLQSFDLKLSVFFTAIK